MLCSNMIS